MDSAATVLDTSFWITAGGIVLLLVLSGFFSGSETALTAASRGKLRSQADKGSRGAEVALEVTEDNERLIGSVLLGNNLVNILAASLATSLFTKIFGESGVALATLVMTLLVLIFAEVLPKTYAITNTEKAAVTVALPTPVEGATLVLEVENNDGGFSITPQGPASGSLLGTPSATGSNKTGMYVFTCVSGGSSGTWLLVAQGFSA